MEAHAPDEVEREIEVLGGLAREADDHVGRHREIGHGRARAIDEVEVLVARVAASHRPQHAIRAGLHRQMQVLADLGQVANRGDQPVGDVARMRAREANARDARNVRHALQQPREVARRRRRAPGSD